MKRLAILGLLLAVASPIASHAANVLYFTSSKSAWVGAGRTRIITPAQGFTFSGGGPANEPKNDIRLYIEGFRENWDLSFAGFNSMPATVGYYPNAHRDIWPASPGLDFGGNGRGDNSLVGSFRVLQADLDTNGNIKSFAADFTQYDEGISAYWNYGNIRFNSDIPLDYVPEPTTATLLLLGMLGCGCRCRR